MHFDKILTEKRQRCESDFSNFVTLALVSGSLDDYLMLPVRLDVGTFFALSHGSNG